MIVTDSWCNGETANCPLLCGGMSSTSANSCFGVSHQRPISHSTVATLVFLADHISCEQQSLTYTCKCANGSEPADIAQYQGTIPNFICETTFAQCRTANPGSEACKSCGTLQATNVPSATPSSSAASSSTEASSTGTAAPATTSKASEGNIKAAEGAAVAGAGLLAALLL